MDNTLYIMMLVSNEMCEAVRSHTPQMTCEWNTFADLCGMNFGDKSESYHDVFWKFRNVLVNATIGKFAGRDLKIMCVAQDTPLSHIIDKIPQVEVFYVEQHGSNFILEDVMRNMDICTIVEHPHSIVVQYPNLVTGLR